MFGSSCGIRHQNTIVVRKTCMQFQVHVNKEKNTKQVNDCPNYNVFLEKSELQPQREEINAQKSDRDARP